MPVDIRFNRSLTIRIASSKQGENSMKPFIALFLMCGWLAPVTLAQTSDVSATDTDIELLRSDVQAAKNDIIAHTMQFTDTESTAFWPVYRDYARDQQAIGDKRVQLIKDYA